ncbi:hypothetical protein DVR11_24460 [Paracoccus versutus]|nr:hypothetical protein DVR11_24460 [Paracoccus versutus]
MAGPGPTVRQSARLGARSILTGTLELSGHMLAASIELVEAASAGILWADRISRSLDPLLYGMLGVPDPAAGRRSCRGPGRRGRIS